MSLNSFNLILCEGKKEKLVSRLQTAIDELKEKKDNGTPYITERVQKKIEEDEFDEGSASDNDEDVEYRDTDVVVMVPSRDQLPRTAKSSCLDKISKSSFDSYDFEKTPEVLIGALKFHFVDLTIFPRRHVYSLNSTALFYLFRYARYEAI